MQLSAEKGTKPPADLAAQLADCARRAERLSPSHRNPERFHEDKSELVARLRSLSMEARRG
ncbi:hypothetical protein [Afifella sp. YEN Y35]|uniref:hypothetical protein n=1 Tax=Afifella sp. YEN Y35 TaxID=3388337 RepID=UPI0039E06BC2